MLFVLIVVVLAEEPSHVVLGRNAAFLKGVVEGFGLDLVVCEVKPSAFNLGKNMRYITLLRFPYDVVDNVVYLKSCLELDENEVGFWFVFVDCSWV